MTTNIIKIKNNTLKLIKNTQEAEIFLDEELIWSDHINNHIISSDKEKSFEDYSRECLNKLSDINNIEEFGKHIDSNDTYQILSSMGYMLQLHFCSEADLNEGQFMNEAEEY